MIARAAMKLRASRCRIPRANLRLEVTIPMTGGEVGGAGKQRSCSVRVAGEEKPAPGELGGGDAERCSHPVVDGERFGEVFLGVLKSSLYCREPPERLRHTVQGAGSARSDELMP